MRERDAVALLGWDGSPLSCHLMLTAGERARLGLLSPGDRAIQRGDPFTTAFGIWGSLTCRAGFVAADAGELPDGIRDYVDRLVGAVLRGDRRSGTARCASGRPAGRCRPSSTATWATRSSASSSILATRSRSTSGSTRRSDPGRRSSCARAWRCRSTSSPRPGRPWFTTNIEDTIALADDGAPGSVRGGVPGGVGAGRRPDGRSCRPRSGSSSTPTSCRSPTSRPGCRRSCSGRSARWSWRHDAVVTAGPLVLEAGWRPTDRRVRSTAAG